MAQSFTHLSQLADSIGNLTSNDLSRLALLLTTHNPYEAADLTDSLRTTFELLEKELEL